MARILVVEDDPSIRSAVATLLVEEGYDVAAAPDSSKGLQATGEWQPTVVLLDPPAGPPPDAELVQSFRRRLPPDSVVLLFTARTGPEELAARIGADGAIPKPYDTDKLLQLLSDRSA